jgi:hypothetical protein
MTIFFVIGVLDTPDAAKGIVERLSPFGLDKIHFAFILFAAAFWVAISQGIRIQRFENAHPNIIVVHRIHGQRLILEVENIGGSTKFRAHARLLGDSHHAPQRYLMPWESFGDSVRITKYGTESIVMANQIALLTCGLSMARVYPDANNLQYF